MKINKFLSLGVMALTAVLFVACNESWSDHYDRVDMEIENDQVLIVNETSADYLDQTDDLSQMYAFLKSEGVFDTLAIKDQLHTLFLVKNEHFSEVDPDKSSFIAKSHVTDIAISPSNLYDGERILMWHGKYISVSMDSLAAAGHIDHIQINESPVTEVIKTKDGYIYVLESMIETPLSMYDIINDLGEEYSLFKDMVMSENVLEFDRPNSKPIGVDNTGNTVYDSVFIITNPFFDAKGFDLTSESLTATVLIPTNEVLEQAMADAKTKLAEWEMSRDTNIMKKWILEVAFFNKKYSVADLEENEDIFSIYGRQWRTTVQQLDTENPIRMSNGIGYRVNWMKIPNNVLMYRLKDYFYYYENCSETQKAEYFVGNNLLFKECVTDVPAWSPLAGVWPDVENRVLVYEFIDPVIDGFTLDFTPVKRVANEDGGFEVKPWKIPPGEYSLGMGFKQSLNLDVDISIIDGTEETSYATTTLGSATTFHYDRGSGSYAEGYKEALDAGLISHSKKGNYDRDGGQIGTVELKGDGNGNPAPFVIRINNVTFGSATKMVFHHWCLRPTSNNY